MRDAGIAAGRFFERPAGDFDGLKAALCAPFGGLFEGVAGQCGGEESKFHVCLLYLSAYPTLTAFAFPGSFAQWLHIASIS